ncbi:Biopolymer transport protein ExbD/TolR [Gluconacetobacter diazotrophicus PA1 5]|uniref:Biopolymer transporter ExbD n=2 Tax=Gluconacetobacter diazotrophicus TaxID=33996 RepID=A0A7W4FD86_GLUDI|nr:biopolymer transporter ExbD [Gluconacetobacter diazotrophicus]ACI51849.1 Biopolymer transport protein ExbD/TolR [Gluconacetobacter diazotrophicus PA1 5]MBB2155595.1 biopolymer transporter ExbD [Gluconacetobacter diazotrophicus]TWB11194.1 outer membrane transport energization protein ExbD [Gluconacetobacter diazotrophicus]CAP55329.1 putative Biopolymer transport exbD2 protein [Gluconacetobacter diazotrophicus PA1 5]
MGMNVGAESTTEDEGIVDINTTPLIDVMLVLLIMLIITIPLQTHSVALDLPQGNPPPSTEVPKVVTVAIDFDNSISWNGEPITDEGSLQAHFVAAAAQPDQPEMHIHPNRLADYKTVAHVLADAQRLGMTKLGIVGQDQFMEGQ